MLDIQFYLLYISIIKKKGLIIISQEKEKALIGKYISLIEIIANGKTNRLNFGSAEMVFYRGEIHLIKMIGDNPGSISAELARTMGVTRAVVHKTLLKLSERGFIEKQAQGDDKKRKYLFLTEKGRVAYKAHQKYHEEIDKPFFDYIGERTDEEQALLITFLEKANEMINNHF